MNDVREISDLVARLLLAVDRLDWTTVRRSFAERIRVDYTSLFGGAPEEMTADELVQRWQGLLPGFDATQHLTGPIVVNANPSSVTAETSVRGYHYITGASGGNVWMVAGSYLFGVKAAPAAWVITELTLQLAYQEGNLALPEHAQRRVAAGNVRAAAPV